MLKSCPRSLLFFLFLFIGIDNYFGQESERTDSSSITISNNVLDGIYIKETVITRNYEYNQGIKKYHNNPSFGIKGDFNPSVVASEEFKEFQKKARTHTAFKPIDIPTKLKKELEKEFVFINPHQKYTPHLQRGNILPALLTIDQSDEWKEWYRIFPNSMRHYISPNDITLNKNALLLELDTNFIIKEKKHLLQPFYFSKYEVTNKEYREFVDWVKDSIAREILFEEIDDSFKKQIITSKGDTILVLDYKMEFNWSGEEEREALAVMYLPNYYSFYSRKQIDPRKLMYSVNDSISINVSPDTLSWVHDFNYSFNEPMTSMYFWHSAYDDYPVVGVNYHQVQAFLVWKTIQHQKKLDKQRINLKIKYSLPNDFQWDLTSTAILSEDTLEILPHNYSSYSDASWITDLRLKETIYKNLDSTDSSGKQFVSTRKDQIFSFRNNDVRFKENFIEDNCLQTSKVKINTSDKGNKNNSQIICNKDDFGICFMGGNVSEWIENDYDFNWKALFNLRQKQLQTSEEETTLILSQIEQYYNKQNHPQGKLVRGGNWYDERFSNLNGKNVAGMNAKTFVHPDSAYSTLGFRYILTFEKK